MVHCPGCNGDTSISPENPFGHILGCGWATKAPSLHPPDYDYAGWRSPWSSKYLTPTLDRAAEALAQFGCRVSGDQVGQALRKALDWWETQPEHRGEPRGGGISRTLLTVAVIVGLIAGFVVGQAAVPDLIAFP